MSQIEARLAELGIILPEPAAPVANYVPFVRVGDLVHIAGQVSRDGDAGVKGVVGEDVDMDGARLAARLCGVNLIAQIKAACGGDLDRVKRVVKLTGFVNSAPDFADQPKVVNGCSDVFVAVFGEAGKHARSAVGVAALPLGVAVEVEGVFEIA
jgi:enamine deaminase RidA (YjgF/YER057c/UK114 family)